MEEIKRDDDLMKKIHEKALEILIVFDSVCKKLGLKYSISSGTLLGAVRHKGFIPWDDDIDVSMPREDYEKFLKQAQQHLPEEYFLEHFTTEKYCINTFAKLKNSNTTWIERGVDTKHDINLGMYIDIFPIDTIKSSEQIKKLSKKVKFYRWLRKSYFLNLKNKSFIHKISKIFIFYPLARIIGLQRINRKEDKLLQSFGKGEYTTADMSARNNCVPYKIFEEFTTLEFEGKQFSAIKDYDTYLSTFYGDYMELPPVEKRHIHFADVIDCDKSYKYYVKKGCKKCKH